MSTKHKRCNGCKTITILHPSKTKIEVMFRNVPQLKTVWACRGCVEKMQGHSTLEFDL